jgi:hypothetical protein
MPAPPAKPRRMTKSSCHRAIYHQGILSRPTDDFDLIYDLLDALDVGGKFLCQLLMEIGTQATSNHEYALVKLAEDVR